MIWIYFLFLFLDTVLSDMVVLESVFPLNEHNHIVSPFDGDGVVSVSNISDCIRMSKYFKGLSYYNQDGESINGVNVNINSYVNCVLKNTFWPQSRSDPVFKVPQQVGTNEVLGGATFNVDHFEDLEPSFDMHELMTGFFKLTEDTLINKRVSSREQVLESSTNTNLLDCLFRCNNNTECRHVEIYKGNVHDDMNIGCRLFSRENIDYDTTSSIKYAHFRRIETNNLVIIDRSHDSKYVADPRTITMIVIICILAILASLGLWDFCESRLIHRFDPI